MTFYFFWWLFVNRGPDFTLTVFTWWRYYGADLQILALQSRPCEGSRATRREKQNEKANNWIKGTEMRGKRKANDRMGHQNWLVINKKKSNVGKWQNRQCNRAEVYFRFLYFFSTIYDFFLYLVSTFATFADCVNMGIIGTCSLQSVLVRRAVMKVNRANGWRKVAFKSFFSREISRKLRKVSKVPRFGVWCWTCWGPIKVDWSGYQGVKLVFFGWPGNVNQARTNIANLSAKVAPTCQNVLTRRN